MPPAKATNSAPRKRIRKRKRRAASSSSSSSSSDSSSDEDDSPPKIVRTVPKVVDENSGDSESESDSSDSTSSSEAPSHKNATTTKSASPSKPTEIRRSPSPSPPPTNIPSFIPPRNDPSTEEKEREMKEKFRKFWMTSVAEGFRDDLEELRKESNLGTGRLALLIDSLASGAEIFSSSKHGDDTEMDIVMAP
ncbi:hypothetical protein AGABI1DRAFT_131609 [Agaricus bisporus var. burnettii JB137-S8]|uniref:Ribosome assembly protein 3 n=1 Tax=Agaricus bisporus var. burnettii (strain JB137-S8 / ATCC MYA-4627 / FGSC 10392) TaxID=597362 RepID=K5XNA4_AGABU|nr:uncharacterized protein AGABI1DRAFT_131609 [Agaricus bisporus var. burnettii JB137-S8]EKM76090.1 hypothetical protein AGABI1DRAFT_131609 [Agaricus bisporus var. burnettii JB137-S8]